jgi:hypothetical protein
VAFALGALVAVGGVSFAIGRWTAEQAGDARGPVPAGLGGIGAPGLPSSASGPSTVVLPGSVASASGAAEAASTSGDPASAALRGSLDIAGQVPGAGMGAVGGVEAMGPGFARGGLEGTVTGIDADSLMLATSDGAEQSVAIDGETRFVSEEEIDPSTLEAGDRIRVQPQSGGLLGTGGQATDGEMVASQVTLLATTTP